MSQSTTEARLLMAWVKLSGILKNNRITKGLMYNEATVMLILYNRYLEDGEGLTSVKEIVTETGMLKSLANRTISALEEKGLLARCQGIEDKRTVYVKCIKEKLDVFLEVHNSSLDVAKNVIEIIGREDAGRFIKIVEKLENSGYKV
ncbi:MAG: MarR family transcriptional regulator [Ruminococcaceae bacterium]|nr:MarR family transcriptional regulator [Oscillospiraceae bacterium]